MALPQGIDFRATGGFVSDPANCDQEIGTTANYPRTSAQGNSVGWEQAPTGTRDRSAAVDARVAGIHFVSNVTSLTYDYRIDLPAAGTYDIRLAIGDATSAQTHQTANILDGTTTLFTVINDLPVSAGQFVDATGVTRTSAADWVTNNAAKTLTFASTILRIRLAGTTDGANTVIAHVNVAAVAAAGGARARQVIVSREAHRRSTRW